MSEHDSIDQAWRDFCDEIESDISPGDLAWAAAVIVAALVVMVLAYRDGSAIEAAAPLLMASRAAKRTGSLESVDSSALDIGLLIASGAMEAPQVRPAARTVTLRQRITRWVRLRFGWALYR